MLILLLIFILLLSVFVLFSENLPAKYHHYIYWGSLLVLLFLCMTRPTSYVSDFKNYEEYFFGFDEKKIQLIVEPTFLWIAKTVYYAGGSIKTVIIIFAFLSIPLKLYSIRKITDYTLFLLTVIVYASNYFMLHDCEQIRLAAGMAFGMFALYQKVERNYILMFFAYLISIAFHGTMSAFAIPLLLTPKEITKRRKIILCLSVPVAVLIWIAHINPISVLPIPYLETRLLLYEMAISNGQHPDVRVINMMVLIRIALFYYIIYYYDTIKEHVKALPILIVSDALSLFCWFSLTKMSVIAVRMSQLFGFIEIILFGCIYYTIKQPLVGKSVVILLALYFFAQNFIYNQFGFR